MRYIKFALISFLFLMLLITLISLLIPSRIRISKAIDLPNRREQIFSLLKNDLSWHPAYQDTATVKTMTELNRKLLVQTDSTYIIQLQQKNRKPVVSGWQLYGPAAADSVTLQWYMDFRLAWYPWEKFSTFFYENTYGAMMEKGLVNLKQEIGR